MAQIEPFRGIRYARADLSRVTAPPYDVISPAEQDDLYARDPSNVVRLILGREKDKYQSAGRFWREWQQNKTLVQDPAPAFYVYRQSFADPLTGEAFPERVGLMCLLKLEPYGTGKVFPHEHTLPKHKADRLELIRATEASFESIYGLYADPDGAVQSFLGEYDDREPVTETLPDMIGSSHSVERIADENAVAVLQEMLADKAVFIADGHHRYETALNYQKEWRDAHPEVPESVSVPADFILITLTAFEDAGLLVLPTHRLVKNSDAVSGLPGTLSADFDVEEINTHLLASQVPPETGGLGTSRVPSEWEVGGLLRALEDKAAAGKIAFGLLLPQNRAFLLTARAVPNPNAPAVQKLAVSVLQNLVLTKVLGLSAETIAAGDALAYTRDASEARARVESSEFGAAFLLPRPAVSEVRDVSLAGNVMPQKSTFFFPKLLSGLVLRDLRPDAVE